MISLENVDWQQVEDSLNQKGYAIIPEILNNKQCLDLVDLYEIPHVFRKTVIMERYRFGLGAYKYFDYPLPDLIQNIRTSAYPYLSPIANKWMRALKLDHGFPASFEELRSLCHKHHQTKPTALILRYEKGGYNTLHQDLYGEIYFPMQVVLFLNAPDLDYTGGEFVLTQQTPRAQSKAIVLKPGKGDMLIFPTNFRPIKGKKGYYRVKMKHGVSEVHSGMRHTLGIIFHDALN